MYVELITNIKIYWLVKAYFSLTVWDSRVSL